MSLPGRRQQPLAFASRSKFGASSPRGRASRSQAASTCGSSAAGPSLEALRVAIGTRHDALPGLARPRRGAVGPLDKKRAVLLSVDSSCATVPEPARQAAHQRCRRWRHQHLDRWQASGVSLAGMGSVTGRARPYARGEVRIRAIRYRNPSRQFHTAPGETVSPCRQAAAPRASVASGPGARRKRGGTSSSSTSPLGSAIGFRVCSHASAELHRRWCCRAGANVPLLSGLVLIHANRCHQRVTALNATTASSKPVPAGAVARPHSTATVRNRPSAGCAAQPYRRAARLSIDQRCDPRR